LGLFFTIQVPKEPYLPWHLIGPGGLFGSGVIAKYTATVTAGGQEKADNTDCNNFF